MAQPASFLRIVNDLKTVIGTNCQKIAIDPLPGGESTPFIRCTLLDTDVKQLCCGNFIATYKASVNIYDKSASNLQTLHENITKAMDVWDGTTSINNYIWEINVKKVGFKVEPFNEKDNLYNSIINVEITSTKK
jgi:hypothetical protein